jgi:signal peptidase I
VRIYPGGPFHVGEIVAFHPPTGSSRRLCGPSPHAVQAGGSGQACDAPTPEFSEGLIYFRRIVAGPGDRIYIKEGRVYRSPPGSNRFVAEPETGTVSCGGTAACDFPKPITIPSGDSFVMNDNRGDPNDSRLWGPVPAGWILGTVRPCRLAGASCIPTG